MIIIIAKFADFFFISNLYDLQRPIAVRIDHSNFQRSNRRIAQSNYKNYQFECYSKIESLDCVISN